VTPLGEKLVARIRADGPMTIAEYMAACLGDPQDGYYTTRDPFGRGGDFITAPEVSQMFGELIGAWGAATWLAMGRPARFILAELGPGRGTLMADALRAARAAPGFGEAAEIHLVETSPRLRAVQEATLAKAGAQATWHDRVADIPVGPMILIANEFFDALPIRQLIHTVDGWAERMVGLAADGDLAFGLRPIGQPGKGAPEAAWRGAFGEISPAGGAIVAEIAARLVAEGGAALIVDYGYDGSGGGDTLQAVRRHQFDDPLAAPGEADLTTHVDFAALRGAASAAGAAVRPLVGQGAFLMRLGLAERAAVLARGKDAATQGAISAAVERLAGEGAMGTLFKVLALSAPGLALPAFDDMSEA
jgi:NADH dehydrogenase [ubiquinone] 1 alpha subcomplex assembly factor 7